MWMQLNATSRKLKKIEARVLLFWHLTFSNVNSCYSECVCAALVLNHNRPPHIPPQGSNGNLLLWLKKPFIVPGQREMTALVSWANFSLISLWPNDWSGTTVTIPNHQQQSVSLPITSNSLWRQLGVRLIWSLRASRPDRDVPVGEGGGWWSWLKEAAVAASRRGPWCSRIRVLRTGERKPQCGLPATWPHRECWGPEVINELSLTATRTFAHTPLAGYHRSRSNSTLILLSEKEHMNSNENKEHMTQNKENVKMENDRKNKTTARKNTKKHNKGRAAVALLSRGLRQRGKTAPP